MSEIATVQDLIEHLEKNFKPKDMLCFFDEGGAWCEVERVPKTFIGDRRWMFNYVKDKKQHDLWDIQCRKEDLEYLTKGIEESYKNVSEEGVVIF